MDEDQVAVIAQLHRGGGRLVIALAIDHHLGAVGAGLLHLHEGRLPGHDDGHRNTQAGRVIGETLAVVAG